MAKDLAEKEREFIEALVADTGSDLSAWMARLSASGQDNRNAIIDWLRQQGFAFPKASWLERIHHNGGKLIYANDSPVVAATPKPAPSPRIAVETRVASEPRAAPEPEGPKEAAEPPPDVPEAGASPAAAGVDLLNREEVMQLLAAAKGLRPLAEMVLREIEEVVPGTRHTLAPPFLLFTSPAQFAALSAAGQGNPPLRRLRQRHARQNEKGRRFARLGALPGCSGPQRCPPDR